MKLYIFLFIRMIIGKRYVINENTKEVHKLSNLKKNCHYDIMNNKKYLTFSRYNHLKLNSTEYDGCRWCNTEDNTG